MCKLNEDTVLEHVHIQGSKKNHRNNGIMVRPKSGKGRIDLSRLMQLKAGQG